MSVCLSVCGSGTLGGTPGHARRACPKGTPEGRAPKGPRRGHCGRRPPGGAGGGGGRGGVTPPKKKFQKKKYFAKNFPEGATATAGRQGVPEGGGGRWWATPPQKKISEKIIFAKKFPEGATAAAGRPGVLKGGRKGGGLPQSPPSRMTGRKAPHNNLVV